MIEGILIGLQTALSLKNILMVAMGCFFGTIIGMLPGLGPMTAIALMIPITYGFEPATGLILMAGVYYGAVFGGSTSFFLFFSYYFLGERRWIWMFILSFPFVALFMFLLHGLLDIYLRDPFLKMLGIIG